MENTENNGMGMPGNAMWGNMNWGNTPPYWGYGNRNGGASGVAWAGLITGIIGSIAALATGGFGLAGMNRNGGQNGPNGPNLYQQVQDLHAEISSVKADVAVNTQADRDLEDKMKLLNEITQRDAKIQTLESEKSLNDKFEKKFDELSAGVLTNAGVIGCVQNNLNKLTQIGIPSANIITPPTGTATTSTAGA